MSIDKSMTVDGRTVRHDRDRFFDVLEYQTDILQYLKETEVKYRARSQYMKKQPDINDSMRSILVDWLVEVSEEYRLQTETLCLAVNYIDRFLSYMSVVRAKLQLVGTAAIYIAAWVCKKNFIFFISIGAKNLLVLVKKNIYLKFFSSFNFFRKYEEIYPPEIGEFVYITDDTYTKAQVLRMEKLLLKVLSFDLCAPTTHTYLNLYAAMLNVPDQIKFLAQVTKKPKNQY